MDNKMDDILLLDAAERYLKGEMSAEEKTFFEELRKNNPEVDQMVVEQTFFINEVEKYGDLKNFKHTLVEAENKLINEGVINPSKLQGKAKVVYLWNRYKRITAVAASIAGIVSVLTAGLASLYSNSQSNKNLIQLSNDVKDLKGGLNATNKVLNEVKNPKTDPKATFKSGGTGFLIDAKGYIITNAHVLKGKNTIATNAKGEEFVARVCMKDADRDIAILKIEDKDFKPLASLPYGINKSVNLAEPIFTMGYPKDEIVYSEGYLSSETGYKSDTLSYQISIAADHGNSGGPVLNRRGDVIGILTDKLNGGFVFAVKSVYIFKAVENLKKDSAHANIKLNTVNTIKNTDRVEQVKKVNSCVFLIKSYE
jgi:serine protease Do